MKDVKHMKDKSRNWENIVSNEMKTPKGGRHEER
jgi:hypothetical protein